MKQIITILMAVALTACSMRGFEPPRSTNYWRLPGNDLTLDEYIDKKNKELRECGIDPFANQDTGGSTVYALCMEKKGWVNTAGPTCEREIYKDDPACDDWKKAHKQ